MNEIKLSQNFTLRELTYSTSAVRLGLAGEQERAPAPVIENLRNLCEHILQPLRNAVGPITINSGYRCKELNIKLGGSRSSQHVTGQAADIEGVNCTNRHLAEEIVRLGLPFDQLILEFGTLQAPEWVHVSWAPQPRRQVLRAYKLNGATQYSPVTL